MAVKIQIEVDDSGAIKVKKFGKEFEKTGTKIEKTSKKMVREFKNIKTGLGTINNKLRKFALIGTAAIGGILVLAKKTADAGDAFQKMSLRTGVSTESLSSLSFVAGLAGTSIGAMENAIRLLARKMSDADDGLLEAKRSFEAVGVAIKNDEGLLKSFEEVFPELISGINRLKTDTEKMAVAQELFGRSGTALLPVIKQGSEAIKEQIKEARALGLVWGKDDADAAALFNDNLLRLKSGLTGVRNAIFNAIIPELSDFIAGISDKIKEFIASGKLKEWAINAKNSVVGFVTEVKEFGKWIEKNKDMIGKVFVVTTIVLVTAELVKLGAAVVVIGKGIIGLQAALAGAAGVKALLGIGGMTVGATAGPLVVLFAAAAAFLAIKDASEKAEKGIDAWNDSNKRVKKNAKDLVDLVNQNIDKLKETGIKFAAGPGGVIQIDQSSISEEFNKAGKIAGVSFAVGYKAADMAGGVKGLEKSHGRASMGIGDLKIAEAPDVDLGAINTAFDEVNNKQANLVAGIEFTASTMIDAFSGAASVIGNEFSNLWDSVFGEADNVFAKVAKSLVMTFVNALLQIAARAAALGVISILFPGLGGIKAVAGMFHDGGMVGKKIPSMHSGGMMPNERIAKVKVGEHITPDYSVNARTLPVLEHIRRTGSAPSGGNVSVNAGNIRVDGIVDVETMEGIKRIANESDEVKAARIERYIATRRLNISRN